MINKLRHYCENSELQFSLEDDALLVDYLCTIADSSNRPKSQLNIVLAAVKAYREALGLGSIRPQITKLVEGLVKSSTDLFSICLSPGQKTGNWTLDN